MANQISGEDFSKALELLKDVKANVGGVSNQMQKLIEKVSNHDVSTSKGISFLEVKYQLLLSYAIDVVYIMCKKMKGKSIQGDPAINRLVENRTVLEKMRPIDQKLKYQIDKLVKTATTGSVGAHDPLRFKPNPNNLMSKLGEEKSGSSEDEEETEQKSTSSKVYRPPKLAAVHYDGDESAKEKQEKILNRAKKRALSSTMIRELRDEYGEGPEEIREGTERSRDDRKFKERTRYEEDYFVRMSLSKEERNAAKRAKHHTGMEDIMKFGDISALTGESRFDDGEGLPSKKRKLKSKGKKKGGKGKKKRFK